MTSRTLYFCCIFTSMLVVHQARTEIKRVAANMQDLKCSYGVKGIAQKIKHYSWFKDLTATNAAKGSIELTLKHGNTINLEALEKALEDAAEKTKYHYDGIKNLTVWGTIKNCSSGYFLQVSGSQDTIYLLEDDHKSASPIKKAFNTVKEWFTGSDEKTRKKIEHLCAENCPVRLCASIHRHDDKTYGVTKIIHLEEQE